MCEGACAFVLCACSSVAVCKRAAQRKREDDAAECAEGEEVDFSRAEALTGTHAWTTCDEGSAEREVGYCVLTQVMFCTHAALIDTSRSTNEAVRKLCHPSPAYTPHNEEGAFKWPDDDDDWVYIDQEEGP